MNRVCRGDLNFESRVIAAVDRANGSLKDALDEVMSFPDGGVEGCGLEVLMAWR